MASASHIAFPPPGKYGKSLYGRQPLYLKIILFLVIGLGIGAAMREMKLVDQGVAIKTVADVILQLLRLLATPLIFAAVLNAVANTNVAGKKAAKLMWVLMSNTVVAILVGLFVANLLQPGQHVKLTPEANKFADKKPYSLGEDLLGRIPKDWITPFTTNEIIGVIFLAVGLGIAMKLIRDHPDERVRDGIKTLQNFIYAVYELCLLMLRWVFELVPLAVCAVVIKVMVKEGIEPLVKMLWFAGAVVLALAIMVVFYTGRLRISSWVRPRQYFKGGFDAFSMAFATASSAATLPVTYRSATEKIGVQEDSASVGIMVGGTFNHDGTALYEAMAALFISQVLGQHLDFGQQIMVVIMAVVASVGAAGIPEAGLVTMVAVFTAVRLPVEYIAFLLPLDWLLDRCRTTVNVMGDLASTCIIDGRTRPELANPQVANPADVGP